LDVYNSRDFFLLLNKDTLSTGHFWLFKGQLVQQTQCKVFFTNAAIGLFNSQKTVSEAL